MKITHDPRFLRDFADLPANIQERAKKKLALFLENPRHPSLQTHKMEGWPDLWEGRISDDYRFTFRMVGDLYQLRRIGTHDIYKSP
jgi:mRNA-degrading endonuclease YafQ of YafQ-DinJ toxin-antitoxin module